MSIENSFCRCAWDSTVELWKQSDSEEQFVKALFDEDSTVEIHFPEKVHYHLASWDLLEDFGDWYRGRSFRPSGDWDQFCLAWRQLGLMENQDGELAPVKELDQSSETEIVFGAFSPNSVGKLQRHLEKIDHGKLDQFIREHELTVTVPFSEQVAALQESLDESAGLLIFAG